MSHKPLLCLVLGIALVCAPLFAQTKPAPSPTPAPAGDAGIRAEIEALKKGQEQILKELQEIKKLVQARPAAAAGPDAKSIAFDVSGRPIMGDPKAPLTLVEFSDYQCPFCSRYHKETHPLVEKEFISTGKVRRVFYDLPLENLHPFAFKAAQAARCAGEKGKFFQMQDRLFGSAQALSQWSAHATAVGLDPAWFTQCVDSGRFADAVRKDMAAAQKAGIQSTPIFLLAKTDPSDVNKVRGIALIVGARPFDAFKAEIEKAIDAAK